MAKKLKKGDTIGGKKSNETKKKSPTKYSDAGKGSKSRVGISPKEWGERYEKIFGKKSDKDGDSIQVDEDK
tara:strand:- start:115 stop:327 length:213 start_codon:yes stop_codon:yes gene_type:complete